MCKVLDVSRSGYYAWRCRKPGAIRQRHETLEQVIRDIHAEPHKDTYGSLRVTRDLRTRGIRCCVNTVAKVMKNAGIQAVYRQQRVRTTDSNHRLPVADNVLDRDFQPACPNAPWAGDITDIRTLEGWLYFALVVDLFSRRIVGWSMSTVMTSAWLWTRCGWVGVVGTCRQDWWCIRTAGVSIAVSIISGNWRITGWCAV